MHVGKKQYEGCEINALPKMLDANIFLDEYIEVNETPVTHPSEQHHHHFICKEKIIDKGI
jgi:hypothetical protein